MKKDDDGYANIDNSYPAIDFEKVTVLLQDGTSKLLSELTPDDKLYFPHTGPGSDTFVKMANSYNDDAIGMDMCNINLSVSEDKSISAKIRSIDLPAHIVKQILEDNNPNTTLSLRSLCSTSDESDSSTDSIDSLRSDIDKSILRSDPRAIAARKEGVGVRVSPDGSMLEYYPLEGNRIYPTVNCSENIEKLIMLYREINDDEILFIITLFATAIGPCIRTELFVESERGFDLKKCINIELADFANLMRVISGFGILIEGADRQVTMKIAKDSGADVLFRNCNFTTE